MLVYQQKQSQIEFQTIFKQYKIKYYKAKVEKLNLEQGLSIKKLIKAFFVFK